MCALALWSVLLCRLSCKGCQWMDGPLKFTSLPNGLQLASCGASRNSCIHRFQTCINETSNTLQS